METVKQYLVRNFEQLFVLLILVTVALVNYFIPYKLAFLNLYYIPVLMAAYYLGLRRALLGAVFCVLMVVIYALIEPDSFLTVKTKLDLALSLTTWAGFLILTGALVGQLHSKLFEEIRQTKALNVTLEQSQHSLGQAQAELEVYAESLEQKVAERTEGLEKSKHAVEDLKKKVEEALYSTMDAAVVKLIIENRLRTEKRRISVLFSDLKDFTSYSEDRRPEMVVTDLNRYLQEMESVLIDYRAHIDKYMGDGIMVEFGAPINFERHSLLAVMAGLKMQERLRRGGFPWQMRVGIATGESITGLIGHRRQSYSAIGDIVNVASRIQGLCPPGRLMIDETTFEQVGRWFEVKRHTSFEIGEAHSAVLKELSELAAKVDEKPDDVDAVKKLAFALAAHDQPAQAHEYFRKALELDPADDRVKLAFAETTLRLSREQAVAVKGRRVRLTIYEVLGLRDPWKDRDKVPQSLFDAYAERAERLADYPADQVLPVECLDGSVGHSRTVGLLAFALGDALGMPDSEKQDLLTAGYFIDIGKTIVPHHLLNRSGTLAREEFEEVVKHPVESVRLLKKMGHQNPNVFALIEAHHERPDGRGYPHGKKGSEIPLGASVLAVADAYDALTSWRPYRERWDYRAAFAELKKDSGKYDPKVLAALGKFLSVA